MSVVFVFFDKKIILNNFVLGGTTAIVNMWAITHDERVWAELGKILPERFMKDVSIMGPDIDEEKGVERRGKGGSSKEKPKKQKKKKKDTIGKEKLGPSLTHPKTPSPSTSRNYQSTTSTRLEPVTTTTPTHPPVASNKHNHRPELQALEKRPKQVIRSHLCLAC